MVMALPVLLCSQHSLQQGGIQEAAQHWPNHASTGVNSFLLQRPGTAVLKQPTPGVWRSQTSPEQALVQVFMEISFANPTPECPINVTFGI